MTADPSYIGTIGQPLSDFRRTYYRVSDYRNYRTGVAIGVSDKPLDRTAIGELSDPAIELYLDFTIGLSDLLPLFTSSR